MDDAHQVGKDEGRISVHNSRPVSPSRRRILGHLGAAAASSLLVKPRLLLGSAFHATGESHTDEEMCRRKFQLAVEQSLASKPITDVMLAIGTSFVGTPYIASTLEEPGREHLVINLRALDCVTFVENTLALARCVKLNKTSFSDYRQQLQLIRYRAGIIDEYPSRLHYFSDWIFDNEKKGIIHDVTKQIGGVRYIKDIDFMSRHKSLYRQLSNEEYYQEMIHREAALNSIVRYFIPKASLQRLEGSINDGDILGITTSVDGLDISHTGIAIHREGVLKYLHAPITRGVVQVTEKSLSDYLSSHKTQTGIMVARPLEPHA